MMEIEGLNDLPGNSHSASLPPTIDVSILQQQITRLPHLIYLLDLAFHGSHHSDHRDSGPVEPPIPCAPASMGTVVRVNPVL